MNKKRFLVFLFIILFFVVKIHAQDEPPGWGDDDPGNLPIPGVLYFLIALMGIGIKKIRDNYKKS